MDLIEDSSIIPLGKSKNLSIVQKCHFVNFFFVENAGQNVDHTENVVVASNVFDYQTNLK